MNTSGMGVVDRLCDLPVYPRFGRLRRKHEANGIFGICEDDDGAMAFVDDEAKEAYLASAGFRSDKGTRRRTSR